MSVYSSLGAVAKGMGKGWLSLQKAHITAYSRAFSSVRKRAPSYATRLWENTIARGPHGEAPLSLIDREARRLNPAIDRRLALPAFGVGLGVYAAADVFGGKQADQPGMVAPYGNMDAAHPASLGATGSLVFSMRDRVR